MKAFRARTSVFYDRDALGVLEQLKLRRAMVVTDRFLNQSGAAKLVMSNLPSVREWDVFDGAVNGSDAGSLASGVERMVTFSPDLLVAFGGSSTIEAAKSMIYLHQTVLRARADEVSKVFFVAIPTTGGAGCEMSNFTFIESEGKKTAIADDGVCPDMAILDPSFSRSLSPADTAEHGISVLSRAVESYVSALAGPFTDALCEKAVRIVFDCLPRAVKDGCDNYAREQMLYASGLAGMSVSNAPPGLCDVLASKLSMALPISYGKAAGLLLPFVIERGAQSPELARKYAMLAKALHLPGHEVNQGVTYLAAAVRVLCREVGISGSLREIGVEKAHFQILVNAIAKDAPNAPCMAHNLARVRHDDITFLLWRIYSAQSGSGRVSIHINNQA